MSDKLLRLKQPEITENYQFEVVESRNELLQDVINGSVLALITIGPIGLFVPQVI